MGETTTTTINHKGQLEVEDVCFKKKKKKRNNLSQSVNSLLFIFSFLLYKLVALEQKDVLH